MDKYKYRPKQQEVLSYTGGKMGVSAVPGSGKTFTLSHLAAKLIRSNVLADDQEIIIVTVANAAADSFAAKIGELVAKAGLLPNVGYRVRTLHGLAHDIINERPELAGLPEHYQIVDERDQRAIFTLAVNAWKRIHPEFTEQWACIREQRDPMKAANSWDDLLKDLATSFIRQAKDLQVSPDDIQEKMEQAQCSHPLLEFGLSVYRDYQRSLRSRNAVDFDDLISMALQILRSDPDYLARLRRRWPFILEDEAQDSTLMQEQILRLLAGEDGNWVRVGDPNQAIYETFTNSNPRYLREFLSEPGVIARTLPESGRNSKAVRELANYLIQWATQEHPVFELRDSLREPLILPPPPDDQQFNHASQPGFVNPVDTLYESEKEIEFVVNDIKKYLGNHEKATVAVLTTFNDRGADFVAALRAEGVKVIEMLKVDQTTRETAETLEAVLRFLISPSNQKKLTDLYQKLREKVLADAGNEALYKAVSDALTGLKHPEKYLAPLPGEDWLEDLALKVKPDVYEELCLLRDQLRKWQDASLLPIDQLVITIAQDLYTSPADEFTSNPPIRMELGLAHKMALLLEQAARSHPEWRLKDFADRLKEFSDTRKNRLSGFQAQDLGFKPSDHPGEVVVSTIHKAKGLEWDRVYLTAANNYDFPSAQETDGYVAEKYFVRDRLNLEAETLSKLKALVSGDLPGLYLADGEATKAARVYYSAERLRLFYVAITRACSDLIITANSGKWKNNQFSLPFTALLEYWKEHNP